MQHFTLPSGWHVVLLVILVKMLSNLRGRTLHEDPLVYESSPSLWRRHLPGTAHGGGSLQHTDLSRELVRVVRLVRV